jgi:hypothetical protein
MKETKGEEDEEKTGKKKTGRKHVHELTQSSHRIHDHTSLNIVYTHYFPVDSFVKRRNGSGVKKSAVAFCSIIHCAHVANSVQRRNATPK